MTTLFAAFFASIDEPLCRVCASCGELANAAQAVLRLYDPNSDFFSPLRNDLGVVEIIDEGLVKRSANVPTSVWLCGRCYKALRARNTPKFSRCSGFRIGAVPEALASLNRIEARLIGLGICFTTCVNLYRDGQEFTKGNAINYWNEPAKVVRELPRPLKECGVVFLASKSDTATKYFRVRPDLVKRALCWLIANNPLYEDIKISEENLQELEYIDVDRDVPTIPVTDDEVEELQGQHRQINESESQNLLGTGATTQSTVCLSRNSSDENQTPLHEQRAVDRADTQSTPEQYEGFEPQLPLQTDARPGIVNTELHRRLCAACKTNSAQVCYCCANNNVQLCSSCGGNSCTSCYTNLCAIQEPLHGGNSEEDALSNVIESFELEGTQTGKQSELERVMNAVGMEPNVERPIGELHCSGDTINEYHTEHLMQNCFPTLFPNGHGGYNPLSDGEVRIHDYSLTEYCAHLMKWHDRRFVIHGNFKFFCMNLIQRRQIDGLVRRVSITETRSTAIRTAGGNSEQDRTTTSHGSSENEKEELNAAMKVLESLKPFFRVVRGSGLYWSNARDDLMSMIGNRALPTRWPTFFLTLSAADTIWPDFARACDPGLTLDECRHLSYAQRRKYLNENPDISARHFNRRFKALFDNILCGKAKPLGEIADYFWRVEFQQRGSPHIHCLLWIRDAPDVLKLSETEEGRATLAEFVDKRISVLSKTLSELEACQCSICNDDRIGEIDILAKRPPSVGSSDSQCDLSRLVQRVQQHVCYGNSSCRKKSSACRFGYPKEQQDETKIDMKMDSDGTPSIKVLLKRTVSTINNYSPHLLSSWRANMDLQLIGNAYGAAEYAGAYISKAEPDTIRFRRVIAKAIQRCDPHLSYNSILKRVANATLSVREVGAPEAIYILLRSLPMHSKSRTVVKVKSLRHNLRYYRVEPRSVHEVAALAEVDSSTSLRIEPIERAYMSRPTNELFDSMSLATFVEDFEAIDSLGSLKAVAEAWKRIDNEGWIKRRAKSVVVQKSPWMKPDASDPNFCFSEIFLYVPWRTFDDLPNSDEDCIDSFLQEQEINVESEFLEESNTKILRQQKLDILKKSRDSGYLASLPASEYVFVSNTDNVLVEPCFPNTTDTSSADSHSAWQPKHNYAPEVVAKASNFINGHLKPWMKEKKEFLRLGGAICQNESNTSHYRYPIVNNDDINGKNEVMADSQWVPFALAMQQSRMRFKNALEKTPCKPLQLVINGEGGSGKSWLIKHIVKDVHTVFGEHTATRRKSKRVLLLAHQGTAAFNIKGTTLCSALSFSSFSRSAFSVPYKSILESKSGPTKLKQMQQQYKDVHLVIIDEFSMISCGMLYWIDKRMREIWPSHSEQLFGGRDVYFTGDSAQLDPVVPSSLSTPISKISNEVQRRGREIWNDIQNVCTLTSQNRGKQDPEWFSALRRLRKRAPTAADIALFNTRCLQSIGEPDWIAKAKHIAYKNVDVDAANDTRIRSNNVPTVHITSQHFVQQKRLVAKRDIPVGTVSALLKEAKLANSDHDRIVASNIKLCVGAPVTLTFNMAQMAGLCNGTNGIVYDFMFVSSDELPIVLVQITDAYLGPSLLDDVPNIVPIAPKDISWGKTSSDLRVVRRGIPLRLAYAMTVHKVQGLTCEHVVFISNSIPSIAFAYVALSRIRDRHSIAITHKLTLDKLTATPEQRLVFEREDQRVSDAVTKTADAAASVVACMKEVALSHNAGVTPR